MSGIRMTRKKLRILIFVVLVMSLFFLLWYKILPMLLMPRGPGKSLTVATTSMQCVADSRENLRNLLQMVTHICESNRKPDLILFGEAILTRYNLETEYIDKHVLDLDSSTMSTIRELASSYGVYICFGAFIHHHKKLYNAQIVVNRDGNVVLIHRKANLTSSEQNIFQPGADPVSFFLLDGIKIGLTICYDIEHSRFDKQIRLHRPVLLLHSMTDPGNPHFVTGSTGKKGNCWYTCANRFGKEGNTDFNGFMAFINPTGRTLALEWGRQGYILRTLFFPTGKIDRTWLLRKTYNSISRIMHLAKYPGKAIDYLRWDRKMRQEKNLPVPIYENPILPIVIVLFVILSIAIMLFLWHRKKKEKGDGPL